MKKYKEASLTPSHEGYNDEQVASVHYVTIGVLISEHLTLSNLLCLLFIGASIHHQLMCYQGCNKVVTKLSQLCHNIVTTSTLF